MKHINEILPVVIKQIEDRNMTYSTDSEEHKENIAPEKGKDIDEQWLFEDPIFLSEEQDALDKFLGDSADEKLGG